MTLRLAIDTLAISHGDLVVRLRPSLRAGYLIACKYSVGDIYQAIDQMSVSVITELVELGADNPQHARKTLDTIIADSGVLALTAHLPHIFKFVGASLGIGPGNEELNPIERSASKGDAFDFKSALERAFGVGTGWLGWTPADTWAATPAEIIAAHTAQVKMLQAIHGSADPSSDKPDTYDPRNVPSPDEVKSNLAAFKSKVGGNQ